jgi:hypothetical protein
MVKLETTEALLEDMAAAEAYLVKEERRKAVCAADEASPLL